MDYLQHYTEDKFLFVRPKPMIKQIKNRHSRQVLGVDQNADRETIRKAYITLAKKYHPDKLSDTSKSSKKGDKYFVTVQRAYQDLMDEFDESEKRNKRADGKFERDEDLVESFNEIKNSWIKFRTKNNAIFGIIKACISSKDYYANIETDINNYYDKMKGDFMDQLNKRSIENFDN